MEVRLGEGAETSTRGARAPGTFEFVLIRVNSWLECCLTFNRI